MISEKDLIKKYDVPAPRYTSYPTVPYWGQPPSLEQWTEHLQKTLALQNSSWSLYLHIPYCETLCTFCGCNNTITKDHKREEPYVKLLLEELKLYLQAVPEFKSKPCKQIHLGGGTPTFLSAENLNYLLTEIKNLITVDQKDFEGAIEVDPRRTTLEQLKVLHSCGIDRISLGVQDFDLEVQRLVNRIQPFEITEQMVKWARELGYKSINFDLIYGLAKQTPESIARSTEQTILLRPDRIALYSFAMVPWIKPAQRLFKDEDLPKAEDKRKLYEIARNLLLKAGYLEVGMDHFALPSDGLVRSMQKQELHRNFMGYTDVKTDILLGLGVSSISETPFSFHQNEKVLASYEQSIYSGKIATFRGHVLTEQDRQRRQQILKFMTEGQVELAQQQLENVENFLQEMFNDGLVEIKAKKLAITEKGKPFLRNACVFFDEHLRANQPQTKIFSQSI